MSRQKIKHGKTVHVCWGQPMDTLFQKMLGGVGRLEENVGVTPFHQSRVQVSSNPSECERLPGKSGAQNRKSARGAFQRGRAAPFWFINP